MNIGDDLYELDIKDGKVCLTPEQTLIYYCDKHPDYKRLTQKFSYLKYLKTLNRGEYGLREIKL